jgi:hypothetical protein
MESSLSIQINCGTRYQHLPCRVLDFMFSLYTTLNENATVCSFLDELEKLFASKEVVGR